MNSDLAERLLVRLFEIGSVEVSASGDVRFFFLLVDISGIFADTSFSALGVATLVFGLIGRLYPLFRCCLSHDNLFLVASLLER